MLASSLSACKTMENLSEKEKVWVAAGAGILAAIVGRATQGGTADGAGSGMEGKSAAAGGTISGDINAAKALRHLYGNLQTRNLAFDKDGKIREWARWVTPEDESLDELSHQTVAVHKLAEKRYTEKGVDKYILVTQAPLLNGSDSSVDWCPITAFGAAVFFKESGQWKLGAEDKIVEQIIPAASSCTPLEDEFTQIGPEKYGIVNHVGAHGAGGGVEAINVLLLNDDGIKWEMHLCHGDYSDMSDPPVGTYDCNVKFDKTSTGEYYDAIVSYKSRASKRAKAVTKTKRLRFVGGEYKEVKTAKKSSTKKRK